MSEVEFNDHVEYIGDAARFLREEDRPTLASLVDDACEYLKQLRQQLEAAETRADNAEAAIREAREQEPAIVVKGRKVVGFNPAEGTRIEGEFYAAPVPAMPIPDDKWIDVNLLLPPDDTIVLGCCDDDVFECKHEEDGCFGDCVGDPIFVSYWMPMPEPHQSEVKPS